MNKTESGIRHKRRDLAGTIEVLFEISDAVTHTRNLAELYGVIHQSLNKILNVNNFYIALLDEDRHIEVGTSFYFGGFGDIRRGITLGTRLAFRHQQLDVVRQRDCDRIVVVQDHRARQSFFQVLPIVVHLLG